MLIRPLSPAPRRTAPAVERSPLLDGTGVVDAVITTRDGGVSTGAYQSLNLGLHVGDDPAAVVENRRRAAGAVGLDLEQLVFCRQSHSANVAVVGSGERGRGTLSEFDALADTDALVTTTPEVGLVVMVADCVPIVLLDPTVRVLACVHAGWRGTVAKVASATVTTMESLGADPSRILAWIGPAISPERYEVGPEVAEAAQEAFPRAAALVTAHGADKWRFDLWSANEYDLTTAGVTSANIATTRTDTEAGPFFSDRAVRPCGRFAAIARLRP